jgi:hypothetical protein
MEERIKLLEEKVGKLEKIIENLLKDQSRIRHNEFVGLEIKDFYCNGFFGRDYDLKGAIIIENTSKSITIRKRDGKIEQTDIDGWDMRKLVNDWTKETVEDE